MIEMLKGIIAAPGKNPVGLVLAIVALALLGAGDSMSAHMVEPWGKLVSGLGAVFVLLAGYWAKKKAAEAPKDPPA